MSKQILLIIPSAILKRGLEQIFSDLGEFEVCGTIPDMGAWQRGMDPDVVIIDPTIFSIEDRGDIRQRLSELTGAAVLALVHGLWDEQMLHQFDGIIGIYDTPPAIIRKVRTALEGHGESSRSDAEELSAREKEILVCVAKGMLNKEIADRFNLSIHTVITHRKNITRKTGIKTVAGLTVYALLNNLIDIGSME